MNLSNGHPPLLVSLSDRRNQRDFNSGAEPIAPSPPLSPQYNAPFSLQSRRLNLRNAGFHGTRLLSQPARVEVSRSLNGSERAQSESAPLRNQRNTSPHNRSTKRSRNKTQPSQALGILQQISSSTQNRHSPKRSNAPIIEDNPERPLLGISAATPEFAHPDTSSIQLSPPAFYIADAGFGTMREISGNERRSLPTLSSPLARHGRGRRKYGLDLWSTTFEASEDIEHIENQLQQAKEAMHSPSASKPLREKLKMLQAENKQLKKTMSELEETFDERVQQVMEHKAAIEVEMHRKIKALEDELVLKEDRIADLQHATEQTKYNGSSMDTLRAMIERLEQEKNRLEGANRVVEKRNEALTELLAQSPTRSHHGFEMASPTRHDSRRTPRPRSVMVPKLSSLAPCTKYSRRSQSIQTLSAQSSGSYFSHDTVLNLEQSHPCSFRRGADEQNISDSKSLDSGLEEPCSARSAACVGSNRTSIASHSSTSPSPWSLPLAASPSSEKATVKQGKYRRTRRFKSGSTQLKPLLLPTMATEGNAFQATYTGTLHSSPTHHACPEESPDPTTSFLSQSFDKNTQLPALPSKWASEAALRGLEASSPSHFESFEDTIALHDSQLAGLDSSPFPYKASGQINHENLLESDSPSCVDDRIVEGDVTTFAQALRSTALDEQVFSGVIGGASFSAPDQVRTWNGEHDEHNLTLPKRQPSFKGLPELQHSGENSSVFGYMSLCQLPANSSRELMPEPLFPPNKLSTTTEASDMSTRRPAFTLLSSNVDDSPVPRKRQRSGSPDSCSFVMPTLCVNHTHVKSGHEKPISVSLSKVLAGTGLKSQSMLPACPQSPLETLQGRNVSPAPLASNTIRTIFRTLSRYTSYVRDLHRDPTALARQVIANAWHCNWKRLGKLSWWVLGLFLGPGTRTERQDRAQGTGRDWDECDCELISGQVREPKIRAIQQERAGFSQGPSAGPLNTRVVGFNELNPTVATNAQNREIQKTSWGKSLYLWGKFSVAIMLAISGAVIRGPEEMLRDCAERIPPKSQSMTNEQTPSKQKGQEVPEEQQTAANADNAPIIGGGNQVSPKGPESRRQQHAQKQYLQMAALLIKGNKH